VDGGMLEVRCAPVQPRDDWERKSPPRGFLFTGRLWNDIYLDELSALTESRVALRPITSGAVVPPPSFDLALGIISFSRILRSWDDKPIAELAVRSEVPVLRELVSSTQRQLLQLLAFLSIILIVLFIAFVAWVQLPLRRLSRSLAARDAEPLGRLQKQKTEYGDFARLIISFFRQQQDLSLEIAERRHAQEELENKNEMLRAREQTLRSLNQQIEANMQQLQASEHTLRESEERYRSLVEHIELGIALIDTD
ncbi:MAG: hypothetical protein JW832_11885, partial [Deltaproteobacteria bacterium]|nr:hypothetical protein [Deltaproteobacteria bacterium]